MKVVLLAAVLLSASPARAADAAALFDSGQFAAAADAARGVRTADSLTLAARATLVVAAYEIADKSKALMLIEEAEADTVRALLLAPGNIDATLQRAIAIGYRAKLTRSPRLAKQARGLMETATKRAPSSALAWASIGGWHGESIVELGKFLAGTMVGASADKSIACYERAVALDPASPVYRTLFAITLAGLGDDDPDRIRMLLTPAANGRGGDGFDKLLRTRARAMLVALGSHKAGALAAAAAKARPFARLE